MGKIIIGLDLGIASVGISIVEAETKKILHRQSHLFKILSDPGPGSLTTPGGYGEGVRGEKRRQRRTIQRRSQRRKDFIRLINDYEVENKGKVKSKYSNIFNFNAEEVKKEPYPIYELAVKGLTKELNPKELFKVLYSKLSFRGVSFNLPNEDMEQSVAIQLLDILNKNKKVRTPDARVNYNDKENNNAVKFSIKRNKKDLEKIIDNCSYLKGTDFKKDFLGDETSENLSKKYGIFSRVRDFSYGPGSEKSKTDFGIYKNNGDKLKNLWETSIGKCPVFPEEYRALKCQALPEISNLLSQLNTMYITTINGKELFTFEQKNKIISNMIKELKSVTPTRIEKWLDLSKNGLNGFPTNKDKSKHNIEQCSNIIRIYQRGILKFTDFATMIEEIMYIDRIMASDLIHFYTKDEIINANKDYEKSIQIVKAKDNKKIIKNYEQFCCLNPLDQSKNKTEEKVFEELEKYQKNNISGTHSLSLKAIYDFIKNNIDSKNPISVYYRKQIQRAKMNQYSFTHSKYINNRLMDGVEFISPNIKNTISECTKLVNKALKKFVYNGSKYELDAIIIETTDDAKYALNGLQNNKDIIRTQMNEEKIKKDIKKSFPNIKDNDIEKIILLRSQDFYDLYDGESINDQDVINNPDNYEIDHILPLSRSQNNNRENKVLTKSYNNSSKGNKTPVEWLSNSDLNNLKVKWKEILKDQHTKLEFMLMEDYYSKERSFIARNLTETQYIMKTIKNAFVSWKNHMYNNFSSNSDIHNQISNLEILTISGSATQRLRDEKYLNIKKDRKISAEHHNVDASICALLGTLPEFRETMNSFIRYVDDETGEVKNKYNAKTPIDIFDLKIIRNDVWKQLSNEIKNSNWILSSKSSLKLSKCKTIEEKLLKIQEWSPKQLSKETIYGYHENNNLKYKKDNYNLLDLKVSNASNEILQLNDIFLCSYKDSKCLNPNNYFESLKKIWNKYFDVNDIKNNPFIKYMEEHMKDDISFKQAYIKKCVKVIDGKLNLEISKLKFIGDSFSGIELNKISNNAYVSGLSPKCIYVVKDGKGSYKFINENWFNQGENKLKETKLWPPVEVIEVGTIYDINNDLYRVTGCHKTNGCLQYTAIQNNKDTFQKPYSSFTPLNAKINNYLKLK